jgi:hypothetical protein
MQSTSNDSDTLYERWQGWSRELRPDCCEYVILGYDFFSDFGLHPTYKNEEDLKYPGLRNFNKYQIQDYYVFVPNYLARISSDMLYCKTDTPEMAIIRRHYWSNRFVETWAEADRMNAIHYPEAYTEFYKTDLLAEAERRVRKAEYWQATAVKVADVSIGAIDTVITKYNHLRGYFFKK